MAFPCKLRHSIWALDRARRDQAPAWAVLLVKQVWLEWVGTQILRPQLAFVTKKGATEADYGGRWFPREWAIGVCRTPNRSLNRAVILHELAHAILAARGQTLYGQHSAKFAGLVHALYARYRVPRRIQDLFDPEIRGV